MKTDSITVDVRLSTKRDSKIKAFADVTIPLGDDGTVTVFGCSVLESDHRPARVLAPARKGTQAWFNIQPVGLEEDFANDEAKSAEWTALARKVFSQVRMNISEPACRR